MFPLLAMRRSGRVDRAQGTLSPRRGRSGPTLGEQAMTTSVYREQRHQAVTFDVFPDIEISSFNVTPMAASSRVRRNPWI